MKVTRVGPAVDPASLFAQAATTPFPFLLESSARSDRFARWSFVGGNPYAVLTYAGGATRLYRDADVHGLSEDPFVALQRLAAERSEPSEFPFAGGGVGYLSYDLRYLIEKLPDTNRRDLNFPDLLFAFYDTVYAIDHASNKTWKVQLDPAPKRAIDFGRYIREFGSPYRDTGVAMSAARSSVTRDAYLSAVRRAKEYIRQGDIYEVNLSQRFSARTSIDHLKLYEKLRGASPAWYSAILQFGQRSVISTSPEEFLFLEGRQIRTRPIKGTRKRGASADEDARLREELLSSSKDDAELAMIVDLERNDLGRVCEFGSVRVTEPKVIEEHATVFHLSATIEGTLRPDVGLADVLRATFPGGSVTGAPKIHAMEIIEELEPAKRSVYCGALGYLGFNGRSNLAMAIRVLLADVEDIHFQVGGAIVADSDPDAEYEETLVKAEGLRRALGISLG